METTIGERRVRTCLHTTGIELIEKIKNTSAEVINLCESIKPTEPTRLDSEKMRYIALAQTAYEEAAMWAIKAATI